MKFAASIISLLIATSACRTSQRPVKTAEEPINVTVRMQGISADDIKKYKLVASLKECAEQTGEQVKDLTYRFTATGITKDATCKVQFLGAAESSSKVSFFEGSGGGVFYSSDQVKIIVDPDGGLGADAYLQKKFSEKPEVEPSKIWKLDVAFNGVEKPSALCTCRITCSPTFSNDAAPVAWSSDQKTGNCRFDNVSSSNASSSCSMLVVQCSTQMYAAKIAPPAAIDMQAGRSNQIGPYKVDAAVPSAEGDVVIIPQVKK